MIVNGKVVAINAVAEEAARNRDANSMFHQMGEQLLTQLGIHDITHVGQGVHRIAGYVVGRVNRHLTVEFRRGTLDWGAEIEFRETVGGARVIGQERIEDVEYIESVLRSMITPPLFSGEAQSEAEAPPRPLMLIPHQQIALF